MLNSRRLSSERHVTDFPASANAQLALPTAELSVEFGISVDESHDRFVVVSVSGEVDVMTAPRLRARLVELAGEGKVNLIVDLEQVSFLDSSGLAALVGALKRVREDSGEIALVCTQPQTLKVFEITGLRTTFAIHPTLSSALDA
jgi:anti-sigma B factor antagonist